MMELVFLVVATAAYGIVYAAAPDRRSLRVRPAARTRRFLVIGCTAFTVCVALAVVTLGPAIGPIMAMTGAMASGSTLIVLRPFVRGTERHVRGAAEIAEPADGLEEA